MKTASLTLHFDFLMATKPHYKGCEQNVSKIQRIQYKCQSQEEFSWQCYETALRLLNNNLANKIVLKKKKHGDLLNLTNRRYLHFYCLLHQIQPQKLKWFSLKCFFPGFLAQSKQERGSGSKKSSLSNKSQQSQKSHKSRGKQGQKKNKAAQSSPILPKIPQRQQEQPMSIQQQRVIIREEVRPQYEDQRQNYDREEFISDRKQHKQEEMQIPRGGHQLENMECVQATKIFGKSQKKPTQIQSQEQQHQHALLRKMCANELKCPVFQINLQVYSWRTVSHFVTKVYRHLQL